MPIIHLFLLAILIRNSLTSNAVWSGNIDPPQTTQSPITDSIDSETHGIIMTTYTLNTTVPNPYSEIVVQVHNTFPLMISAFVASPILLVLVAAIYNARFKGSDPPNFSSILQCFLSTTDLYIDIIFCALLLFKLNTILFTYCSIFIALSHLISNLIALYYIKKWQRKCVSYIEKYNGVVTFLSLIVGFYAAIQLLSSKLFYFKPLSMQLSNAQIYKIQILTICNNVLFRNIPLLVIQILFVSQNEMDIITAIALISTLFKLVTGSLTVFSRCISTKCQFKYHFTEENRMIHMILKSDDLELHHQFCHSLLAECFALSLSISSDRVETLLITPIQGGISCNIEVLLADDEDQMYQNLMDMHDERGAAMCHFEGALCKVLHIVEMDASIVMVERSNDSQLNMSYECKSVSPKMKTIELVMHSSPLLNNNLSDLDAFDDSRL
eukprot:256859_1